MNSARAQFGQQCRFLNTVKGRQMKVSIVLSFIPILLLFTKRVTGLVDESSVECDRLTYGGCHGDNGRGRSLATGEKAPIYFALMLTFPDPLNRSSFAGAFEDGHDLAPAAYLAVEQVNNRTDLLGDYEVRLIRIDDGCDISVRTSAGINELSCSCVPIVGIIGPSCEQSSRVVSQLTGNDELSMITINYGGSEFFAELPYAFGILGSSSRNVVAIRELIKHNNWTSIALLYSDSHSKLSEQLQLEIASLPQGFEVRFVSIIYNETFIPLKEVRDSFARIIIVLTPPQLLLHVLCLAYHENLLFPSYQFVFIEAIDSNFEDSISLTFNGRMFYCSKSDINKIVNGSINFFLNAVSMDNVIQSPTEAGVTTKEYYDGYEQQIKVYSERFGVTSRRSEWSKGFFDAVWSLSIAVNNSLKDLNMSLTEIKPGSRDLASTIRKQLVNLDIQGVTGRINFDEDTGFNVDGVINVYQYAQNSQSIKIGCFDHQNLTLLQDGAFFINASFNSEYVHADVSVAIVLLVFSAITLLLAIPVQMVNICYRNHKTIKASSPILNNLIFLGCYVVIVCVTLHIIVETFKEIEYLIKLCLCNAIPWLLNIGATLIIGTVCIKTWRLHRIYTNSKRLRRHKKMKCMTNTVLGGLVLLLVVFDIFVCIVWSVTDPLKPKETNSEMHIVTGNKSPIIAVTEECQSEFIIYWLILLLAPKVALLLCSFFLALLTRIDRQEFKTINVIVLVYLLAILLGLGVPVYVIIRIVDVGVTVSVVILSLLLDLTVLICVFALFVPPVYVLIRHIH